MFDYVTFLTILPCLSTVAAIVLLGISFHRQRHGTDFHKLMLAAFICAILTLAALIAFFLPSICGGAMPISNHLLFMHIG